ncbi:MAG: branched-chain amino acid ABC transporter permease [Deltaproteobacteria bacterium]|nr:branched-chain amino acid ABC transporter permease [Deltaproteobacteria bacterium]
MLFQKILKFLLLSLFLWGANTLFANYLNPYITQILCMIGINILMAASLNLINGITGQFSIGHAGFMAIGAYISAAITVYGHTPFFSKLSFLPPSVLSPLLFILALVSGGLCAGLTGLLVGIPTLRLRGDYLAIATLGFGEIIRVIVLNLDVVGGARGFSGIPEYSNFFWIYLFLGLTLYIISNLVRSSRGKALLAIREDEIASESIGIPTSRYKIIAFTLGAFFAGIGGGLFAHLITYLHTNSFTFLKSIEFIVMVVLGGLGSLTGSILSATLLTLLPEVLRSASEWRMIIYAVLLMIMMWVRPQGILGNREWFPFKKSTKR